MNLTINGKNIETRFGMAFIREAESKYTDKSSKEKNITGQNGIIVTYTSLYLEAPRGVAEVIHLATSHLNESRPSVKDIENFLDDTKDFQALCSELRSDMEKQTMINKAVGITKDNLDFAKKEDDAEKKKRAEKIQLTNKS